MQRRTMLTALLTAGMAAGATIAGTAGATAATSAYTVTDLGTLSNISSSGGGLNATGQVSGTSAAQAVTIPAGAPGCPPHYGVLKPCVEHPGHAFLYSAGTMTDLGTLGGLSSSASSINATGTVAGSAATASGVSHAFVDHGGVMTDLGTLDGASASSNALAINGSGQVAGWSTAPGGTGNVAALFANGAITDIGTIDGGTSSVANGINAAGVVIGNSDTAASDEHGFVYQNGTVTDIGTLGGPNSSVDAINDNGVVAGSSQDAADVSHPVIYANGKLTSLGTYNIDTTPQAINDNGVIVGTTYGVDATGLPFTHAYIYQAGTFQDLNNLIPAGSGWQLTDAVAVNLNGQIVVDATNTSTGQNHALLLNPTN